MIFYELRKLESCALGRVRWKVLGIDIYKWVYLIFYIFVYKLAEITRVNILAPRSGATNKRKSLETHLPIFSTSSFFAKLLKTPMQYAYFTANVVPWTTLVKYVSTVSFARYEHTASAHRAKNRNTSTSFARKRSNLSIQFLSSALPKNRSFLCFVGRLYRTSS